jgi:hypothetical protein
VVAGYRRARRADTDVPDKDHLLRYLSYYFDDDGSFLLKGRLSAEDGAVVAKALDATLEAMWKEDRVGGADAESSAEGGDGHDAPDAADVSVTHGPERRADALVMMADTVLAHGATTRPSVDRHQVVVHVDEGALIGEDGCSELDAGVGIDPETASRIACDASIVTLMERDGVPVNVGRKRRTVPPSLRRALEARDRGCRFPGCTHTRFTDAHHLVHWAKGGETALDNLALLCRAHHRLVHEGGYEVRLGGGTISFVRPDGAVVEPHPRRGLSPRRSSTTTAGDGRSTPTSGHTGSIRSTSISVCGFSFRRRRCERVLVTEKARRGKPPRGSAPTRSACRRGPASAPPT